MMRAWMIGAMASAAVGAGVAWSLEATLGAKTLAREQAAHARDNERHALEIKRISDRAARAASDALAAEQAMEARTSQLDASLTRERIRHETEAAKLRTALAAGTQRLRIAVRNCQPAAAGGGVLPGYSGTPGVGHGAATTADLDPATARRLVEFAQTEQREIDKLRALQAWVCAINADMPGCAG